MTKDDYARAALGMIVGGISAVAITKSGLNPSSATLRWIAYCVVAGVLINSQTGMKGTALLLSSLLSAIGLVGALLWMTLLGEGVVPAVSGVGLDFVNRPGFSTAILGSLLLVSTLGVAIGGMARPAMLSLIQTVSDADIDQAKRVEGFLKVLISIAGTASVFLL